MSDKYTGEIYSSSSSSDGSLYLPDVEDTSDRDAPAVLVAQTGLNSSNEARSSIDNGSTTSQPPRAATADASNEPDRVAEPGRVAEDRDLGTNADNVPRKRKYNYRIRVPALPKSPSRQVKWMANLEGMSEQKLRRTECCKSLKCFKHVDFDYYLQQARHILSVSYSTRRTILRSYLGSGGSFIFDGKHVCAIFLKKAFRFSTTLIAEVSRGNGLASPSTEGCSRPVGPSDCDDIRTPVSRTRQSNSSRRTSDITDESNDIILRKKEAIVSFLHRLAEDCGDSMPDRAEIHLPFHQRRELYPMFVSEFHKLYPSMDPATPQYFRRTWRLHCPQFKVMKAQRFSTCDECDRLRTGLREALMSGQRTDLLKDQRKTHLKFIFQERLEYQKKKDRARLHSSDCCSIIIDGADQSAFGIPHFTTKPKSQRGHAMKVKLIGLLEHKIQNKLTLYTMTEEHSTGANHVIEVLHRFLNVKRSEGPLPAKFYVQLDNCSRENKNKYVMAYFEMLVSVGVFESVEVGFLPVGHTHEDVDQSFSQTSSRLRVHNAITLRELHLQLRQTNKGGVEVQHLKRIANFSGLCDQENCMKKIDRITQWRYFLFTRNPSCSHQLKAAPLTTKCFVKKNSKDVWQNMFRNEVGSNPFGILRHCPDIRKTPPLNISCPEGLENVCKRLESEEGRINDAEKMITLHELRDFVFSSRVDQFHWDIQTSVETEFCGLFTLKGSSLSSHSGTENPSQSNEVPIDQEYAAAGNSNEVISSPVQSSIADEDCIQVETTGRAETPANSRSTINVGSTSELRSKVDYAIGSFVAVQHNPEEASSSSSIWIAQVLQVHKRANTSFVEQLKVHWFDRADQEVTDIVQAKFQPCYQNVPTKKSRKVSRSSLSARQKQDQKWCDTIHTDTVLVSFPALTKRGNLPLSVQKKISG